MRRNVKPIRTGRTDCVHHKGVLCDCMNELYCIDEVCKSYMTPQQWDEMTKKYPHLAAEKKPKGRPRKVRTRK